MKNSTACFVFAPCILWARIAEAISPIAKAASRIARIASTLTIPKIMTASASVFFPRQKCDSKRCFSREREILAQIKLRKAQEHFVYFNFLWHAKAPLSADADLSTVYFRCIPDTPLQALLPRSQRTASITAADSQSLSIFATLKIFLQIQKKCLHFPL